MNYGIKRTLTFFSKETERLVGEVPLVGIGLVELQDLFDVEAEDPMYDCFIVGPEHVAALQPHVSETIELDRYDYFVEATGTPIPDGTITESSATESATPGR